MDNRMRLKLKRKEFDDSSDELVFSDFCFSSPAFKIRRLDAALPPITEEEVAGIPLRYEQHIPESAIPNAPMNQLNPLDMEELPLVPENNEKALVLFKPMNNQLRYSPNNLSVDSNLISSFKNQALLYNHRSATRSSEEDDRDDGNCKAIIPWIPSHQAPREQQNLCHAEVSESMEAEDTEEASSMMEVDDASRFGEGVQQCHQRCMIPEPSHNTPIMWYR